MRLLIVHPGADWSVSDIHDGYVTAFKALGHEGAPPDFKGVAAWVGYKVHREDVWKRVKSGELRAFSIEGTAEREEVPA